MNDLRGKKITVLGAGLSGQALALAAADLGGDVFVSEAREELSKEVTDSFSDVGIKWEVGGNTDSSLDCDLMILSSGVSPKSEIVVRAMDRSVAVQGEVDFVVPRLKGKVLAVTGTNGKTTTTSLTAHLLASAGLDGVAVGNIGTPLGVALKDPHDFFVVELSSFQLYWTKRALFDGAVVTNLAPDHLDWHGGLENYVAAKRNALTRRREGAWAIAQERDLNALGLLCDLYSLPLAIRKPSDAGGIYMDDDCAWIVIKDVKKKLFDYDQVPMVGFHNLENAAMAVGGCIALDSMDKDWCDGLAGYTPPSHRCQFVACVEGVTYIDDSKGTNVASTCTALDSIKGKKVVILGGRGKGESYSSLALAVKKNCKKALLIGEERFSIGEALRSVGFDDWATVANMEEAVAMAESSSASGDTVLLSPACTSWDMYGSYVERGNHFRRLVMDIKEKNHRS